MNDMSRAADWVSSRMTAVPESSTVRLADKAEALRREDVRVIDFSAGRAAEATPPDICNAAIEAINSGDTHQTMARGKPEFLAACAEKLKRCNNLELDPARNIVATLGCKQGLTLALLAAIDPGDEVIIEDPCFVSFGPTVRLCGGVPVPVTLRRFNGYRWQMDELESAVTPRTRAILFCSPHNPTGTVHTAEDLNVIADVAIRHDLLVIADEIYEAVTWHGRRHIPIASLPGMQARTIGLMGMTKSYSMGGWRIGYAYAGEDMISAMVTLQQHLLTCASSFGQVAAAVALSAEVTDRMAATWLEWQAKCDHVATELDAHPALRVSAPESGFCAWVDISRTGLKSEEFAERLLIEQQVAVVPGIAFGASADDFVRVTCVKSWPDVREGVARVIAFADSVSTN